MLSSNCPKRTFLLFSLALLSYFIRSFSSTFDSLNISISVSRILTCLTLGSKIVLTLNRTSSVHARCLCCSRCRFNPWNTNCMLDTNILLNSSRFYQRDLFFFYHFHPSIFLWFDFIFFFLFILHPRSSFMLCVIARQHCINDVPLADYIFHFTISVRYFSMRFSLFVHFNSYVWHHSADMSRSHRDEFS